MPMKPLRPCSHPGCRNLSRAGRCEEHRRPAHEADRLSAHQRGYTWRWRRESKAFLADNPWCAECGRQGHRTLAQLVDHVTPHKGDSDLFWDSGNWQPLCKRCHDRKTAREDGGFGDRRA